MHPNQLHVWDSRSSGIVLETPQGRYCRDSGVLKMERDHFPGVVWEKKSPQIRTGASKCCVPSQFPFSTQAGRDQVLVGQSQVLVAISERVLGAAESLLEGFPLAPEAQGKGDVFVEICSSTFLAGKPERIGVFCPQLHVYGQCETPPVITTCGLCETAVN